MSRAAAGMAGPATCSVCKGMYAVEQRRHALGWFNEPSIRIDG
jgi:hypothetical protein